MFKKTLIAAAIVVGSAAPAFAGVVISPNDNTFVTTSLASVTKQPVLDFSTAQQNLTLNFSEVGDLKNNGFIVLEIQGEGQFNDAEIRQWLSNRFWREPFTALLVSPDDYGSSGEVANVRQFFKIISDGSQQTIDHTIDNNGKRLRLALASDVETTSRAGAKVELKLNLANQAFKLTSGSQGTVALTAGALWNASYTADPVATKPLFKLGKLFQLSLTNAGKATALVSEGFLKLDIGDADISATDFAITNVTTNQTIQRDKVNLTLTGDVSAFKKDANGNLVNKAGVSIGWKAAADGQSATAVLGAGKMAGGVQDALAAFGTLYVAADNTVPIPVVNFNVKAEIQGNSQATYNYFKDELADLFILTRDGMKFDTITTGTTSANLIHIRDVSNILPTEGGKIFVTITEYADHAANGRGEGTVLVTRKALSVTLPSGGAVTLKPADVAADVGASITAGRQARFLFEVETNQGEVAVKKSNAEGVDIQNGTRGTAPLVDFTL
ncbi:S-layer protein [Aeromonas salmonicida]|uniref:VapA family S-layer protein n=1 Tax=Aeromonas salmonicida TaxID=645 RepID=UPI002478C639|nr:S-layer protein [Aeromonas salmonicida]MDH7627161.1 S-layer protein [Aeromonas salmonicida]